MKRACTSPDKNENSLRRVTSNTLKAIITNEMKNLIFLVFAAFLLFGSCTSLKEYEKVNINDKDMALKDRSIDKFQTTFQSYREAASGANGGKTGGGCGCN